MLWICTNEGCKARYSVGAPRCPQCGSTEHVEEGHEDMPKITVHGGPSVADEKTTEEQAEESEQSSDGTNSSASSKTQPSSGETSGSDRPSTARAAANRSRKG